MRMRAGVAVLMLAFAAAGCAGDDETEDAATIPADTLTAEQQRARRDSAVAGSNLPGAAGVGRAMDAAEAARARAEATDTMLP